MKKQDFIKLIHSVDTNRKSVIELNVSPGERTPWHYHTLFLETFEVLKGTLQVGKGKNIYQLKQGEKATIQPNEKHYYHNISTEECVITTTIEPGNKNFEDALFILKGLSTDGLANAAGTPAKFFDLVLFVYLSNSKMIGIQKIAEPLFYILAKIGIKNGRLKALIDKYGRNNS